MLSRYKLAKSRGAHATVQWQIQESFRDASDSIKTLALYTTLMSSIPVYCVVFYFTSMVNIWAISAGFALLGGVWDCCLEKAMLKLLVITYVLALYFLMFFHKLHLIFKLAPVLLR